MSYLEYIRRVGMLLYVVFLVHFDAEVNSVNTSLKIELTCIPPTASWPMAEYEEHHERLVWIKYVHYY